MQSSTVRRLLVLLSAFSLLVFAGACKKKVAPAPPPPPAAAPPPAQPTVTLNATSTSIQSGQSTTLNWTSTDATSLDLEPGVGKVAAQGSSNVSPTDSTTYTITATGPGGTATANVAITVTAPPPPAAPAAAPNIADLFSQNVTDAFFDYNKSDVRPDARAALQKDAEFLRSYPQVSVTIEGHCDERGSEEYNLGLGQRRAEAAKQYLVSLGISADRMKTMSWGKEHPFCTEHNETCWQQNRRAHFVMAQQQ
ncbi:MAG TPA: peptidoglycan-associated lipoprotein Pal [Candidatus Limnocylindrales bacterium]|nr:peptidoglycan-associated lipoprotein Pal [Candidatus Limnocylindrales bacterium]